MIDRSTLASLVPILVWRGFPGQSTDSDLGIRPIAENTRPDDQPPMPWRDHMLRLLARGFRTPEGRDLDHRLVVRVLDNILEDTELSEHLDSLDERSVRTEFLRRYERLAAEDAAQD